MAFDILRGLLPCEASSVLNAGVWFALLRVLLTTSVVPAQIAIQNRGWRNQSGHLLSWVDLKCS